VPRTCRRFIHAAVVLTAGALLATPAYATGITSLTEQGGNGDAYVPELVPGGVVTDSPLYNNRSDVTFETAPPLVAGANLVRTDNAERGNGSYSIDVGISGSQPLALIYNDLAGSPSWIAANGFIDTGTNTYVLVNKGTSSERSLVYSVYVAPFADETVTLGAQTSTRAFYTAAEVPPSRQTVTVYLLAGQSNMLGRGETSALPAALTGAQHDVMFDDSGAFDALAPAGGSSGEFGPEVLFGRTTADALSSRQIALVKHAVGGTNLASDWDPSGGPQYTTFINRVDTALQRIRDMGLEPELGGMLWMQGERDSRDQAMADAYQTNLVNFITAVRDHLDEPDLPFIIGLPTESLPPGNYPYQDTVRAAQRYVNESMGSTAIVETADLTLKSDNVHFDGAGQIGLGERFAAMQQRVDTYIHDRLDFNTAGEFDAHFTQVTYADPGADPMVEADGIGIGGSRGVTPAKQRITAVYDRAFDLSGVGNYVMLSLMLEKSADNNNRVVTSIAGLLADPADGLEPVPTNWAGIRLDTRNNDNDPTRWLWDWFLREGGASFTGPDHSDSLVEDHWYKFVVKIRNEGQGQIGLWGALEDWGDDGLMVLSTVFTTDWTLLDSSLAGDPTVYAAWRADVDGGVSAIDNWYVESFVVPEPVTLVGLAAGAAALAGYLRRRRAGL